MIDMITDVMLRLLSKYIYLSHQTTRAEILNPMRALCAPTVRRLSLHHQLKFSALWDSEFTARV